jgi:hypothetical protein
MTCELTLLFLFIIYVDIHIYITNCTAFMGISVSFFNNRSKGHRPANEDSGFIDTGEKLVIPQHESHLMQIEIFRTQVWHVTVSK